MISKTKTTATKEEATPALVPKMRFPEFRGAEAWEPKTLAEICLLITNGKANAQDHEEDGEYPLFDRSAVIKKSSEFMFDTEAVILPGEGMRFVPKYFRGKFNLHQRAYALMRHQGDGRFVYHSLDYFQDALAEKAVKSTVLSLRLPIVENFVIGCPKPAEQQKIAECLSSVDELMAAQARKVDALKTHKKGLMQQLFPREGETQPRLRFPEFQNAGEWQQKLLGGLCRIRTGKKDANEGAADGAYPFFTCAEKHIYSHNYSFDAEAILIAGNANVGQTSYYIGKFEAYQRTYVLTDFKGIFVPYLYSILNANLRPDLLAQVQTSAMSYIRLPMLEEYQINAPPSQAEQHHIASCLSSLDALITAETQKLEALKTHKRGLMQQLFPSPEEATS